MLGEILHLVGGAADEDGLQGQVGGLHDGGKVAVIVTHLFVHDLGGGQVHLVAAVLLGDLEGVQAQLEGLGVHVHGDGLGGIDDLVPFQHDGFDFLLTEFTDGVTPLLLFFCQHTHFKLPPKSMMSMREDGTAQLNSMLYNRGKRKAQGA